MSNSLDPDQARRLVGPDLGPNCLPRLSADDTGRQRVKRLCRLTCTCTMYVSDSVGRPKDKFLAMGLISMRVLSIVQVVIRIVFYEDLST